MRICSQTIGWTHVCRYGERHLADNQDITTQRLHITEATCSQKTKMLRTETVKPDTALIRCRSTYFVARHQHRASCPELSVKN